MDKYKELRELLVNSSGQIAQLLAERDALLGALENIASGEIYPVQIARAAIEAAKRQEGDNNE